MAPSMNFETDDCSSNPKHLHFLLVPLLAQGHMIPMVDLAKFLAARGILVSLFSTSVNLARIQPIVDKVAASTLPIRFIELPFPAKDVGLPDGCESADLIPSLSLFLTFMNALHLLRDPLEAHLNSPDPSQWPKPACIISDSLHHWTADIARTLNIPRIIFHGLSCFFSVCFLILTRQKAELEDAMEASPDGQIMLPGLPQPIWVSKHDVIPAWQSDPVWSKFVEKTQLTNEAADGVIVNSFTELEPCFFEMYREMKGKPIWPVGPLSLYKEELDVKATRGRASSIDNKVLLEWLDKQEIGSVVLVNFGSIARNTMAQLVELGSGLEACGRPFIWVVKEAAEVQAKGLNEWIDGFEKRVEERGIVIRGWAPQTVILEHIAVGGFVTHCGWNSTLEAVAAGVVMVTWPHFADQFFNERLIVDVLKIGVAVGVKEPSLFVAETDDKVVKVKREEVASAVESLMCGGEEGEERRARAREFKEKARMAMEEGGSSWKGLENVINYVKESEKRRKQSKQGVDEAV